MPSQSSNMTALRGAYQNRLYMSVMTGDEIYSASFTTTPGDGWTFFSLTPIGGDENKIRAGMRGVVESASGAYKGTLIINANIFTDLIQVCAIIRAELADSRTPLEVKARSFCRAERTCLFMFHNPSYSARAVRAVVSENESVNRVLLDAVFECAITLETIQKQAADKTGNVTPEKITAECKKLSKSLESHKRKLRNLRATTAEIVAIETMIGNVDSYASRIDDSVEDGNWYLVRPNLVNEIKAYRTRLSGHFDLLRRAINSGTRSIRRAQNDGGDPNAIDAFVEAQGKIAVDSAQDVDALVACRGDYDDGWRSIRTARYPQGSGHGVALKAAGRAVQAKNYLFNRDLEDEKVKLMTIKAADLFKDVPVNRVMRSKAYEILGITSSQAQSMTLNDFQQLYAPNERRFYNELRPVFYHAHSLGLALTRLGGGMVMTLRKLPLPRVIDLIAYFDSQRFSNDDAYRYINNVLSTDLIGKAIRTAQRNVSRVLAPISGASKAALLVPVVAFQGVVEHLIRILPTASRRKVLQTFEDLIASADSYSKSGGRWISIYNHLVAAEDAYKVADYKKATELLRKVSALRN